MIDINDRFFVHIIESPADFDLLDGRTEGRVLLEALNLSSVPAAYSLVTTCTTLDEALGNRLIQASDYYKRIPILHLSLHGNSQGIELTDKYFITWHDLRELLLPINQRFGNALLVCLSSCFGAAGCRMAMYENLPIPFVALVGHLESATWSDAAVGFVAFYHRLRKGADVFQAVQAMKVASGDERFLVSVGSNVQADFVNYLRQQKITTALRDVLNGMAPNSLPFNPGPPSGCG
jgi:hypothetical protein